MSLLTIVHNDAGVKFRVCLIRKWERYGLPDAHTGTPVLTHDKDNPLVEFWDCTHVDRFGAEGQFVTRYDVETLHSDKYGGGPSRLQAHGLCLDGGVPAWVVSAENMREVYRALRSAGVAP